MWNPTHLQVTVVRAKNLLVKGKNGTNNPFVTIGVGKEKFQTSVKEKVAEEIVCWQEQCELSIVQADNTAALTLTVLHRTGIVDQFLGTVSIPLSSLPIHERPKCRWYKLQGKPGKDKGKDKERGEIEVRIAFTVKASTGSLMDLSKKEKYKSSLGHLSAKVGGSLLSLGSVEKRAGLKKIAKNIGHKVTGKKRDADGGDGASEKGSLENVVFPINKSIENVDPGVISEDEDEFTFDNLSHKSSGSSLNVNNSALENLAGGEFLRRSTKGPPAKPPRTVDPPSPSQKMDEWEQKLTLRRGVKPFSSGSPTANLDRSPKLVKSHTFDEPATPPVPSPTNIIPALAMQTPSPKPAERRFMSSPNLQKQDTEEQKEPPKLGKKFKPFQALKKEKKEERFIVGEEASVGKEESSRHSKQIQEKFRNLTRDDLIDTVLSLQNAVNDSRHQVKELEEYLDELLLRVMETTPRILQRPFGSCKTEFKSH